MERSIERTNVLSPFDTALNANSTELPSMADGIVNMFRYAERGSVEQLPPVLEKYTEKQRHRDVY